jgi:hypothetical protein
MNHPSNTYQNTNTQIPYTISPKAAIFIPLLTEGSSPINCPTSSELPQQAVRNSELTFQKNNPGRMNEIVVDPVAPTNEST